MTASALLLSILSLCVCVCLSLSGLPRTDLDALKVPGVAAAELRCENETKARKDKQELVSQTVNQAMTPDGGYTQSRLLAVVWMLLSLHSSCCSPLSLPNCWRKTCASCPRCPANAGLVTSFTFSELSKSEMFITGLSVARAHSAFLIQAERGRPNGPRDMHVLVNVRVELAPVQPRLPPVCLKVRSIPCTVSPAPPCV